MKSIVNKFIIFIFSVVYFLIYCKISNIIIQWPVNPTSDIIALWITIFILVPLSYITSSKTIEYIAKNFRNIN
ncbi:hypothetical protein [Tepidibacter mesophilus]|uniref:hypothetical protein n=1 Tax=Tepidibacter mesophilus TaxID=655607 RepID=UPI000C06E7D9|nr:hypothetical protein [Tepidibacter mesophilus]